MNSPWEVKRHMIRLKSSIIICTRGCGSQPRPRAFPLTKWRWKAWGGGYADRSRKSPFSFVLPVLILFKMKDKRSQHEMTQRCIISFLSVFFTFWSIGLAIVVTGKRLINKLQSRQVKLPRYARPMELAALLITDIKSSSEKSWVKSLQKF